MEDAVAERSKIEIPEGRRFVSVSDDEARFLRDFVGRHEFDSTLEVGLAWGLSATSILGASTGTHVIMDPNQSETYEGVGLRNIEALGFEDRVEFHEDFSHAVLPKLHAEGRTFDFAFVDGDHRFDGVFTDFVQVDRILKTGGFVLFHDTWMRGIQLTAAFIRTNRADYVERSTGHGNLVLFEKVGQDERDWIHFREFHNWKSRLLHPLIVWGYHSENSGLKRFLKRCWRVIKPGGQAATR